MKNMEKFITGNPEKIGKENTWQNRRQIAFSKCEKAILFFEKQCAFIIQQHSFVAVVTNLSLIMFLGVEGNLGELMGFKYTGKW